MNLYSSKPLRLPPPSFVIFYNGITEQPERSEYRLSDLFHPGTDQSSLEPKAVMLNNNKGHNSKLKAACRTLRDYSEDEEKALRIGFTNRKIPLSSGSIKIK